MLKSLLARKKDLNNLSADGVHESSGLKRILSVRDLTSMGIAAVIGAGIFSTIGQAAYAGGPGVVFLFVIVAVTCGFTALCYAEFAARVPVAGSAYTYTYVTIGELAAWIIGWALILEYAISNVVVAISWSKYFVNLLEGLRIHLPTWIACDPKTAHDEFMSAVSKELPTDGLAWATAPELFGVKIILNIPAFVIVILITAIAYIGIRESKRSANAMVVLKLIVLAFIVGLGVFYVQPENWSPFLPHGFSGVMQGVSAIFFAYIGFDSISTTAEECANPQRDMPRGMLYSLLICSVIYIVITLIITGMVNYSEFEHVADPLAYVFEKIHLQKIGFFISIGAVIAAMSAMLVYQVGQPRIWMSMSRDGLLPKRFGRIHPKFHTPSFATIITGLAVGVPALFVDIGLVTDLTSIGTLFAFILVCAGVLKLPRRVRAPGDKSYHLPYINGKWIVPVFVLIFFYFFQDRLTAALVHPTSASLSEWLFLFFGVTLVYVAYIVFQHNLSLIPVLGLSFCLYLMIEIPAKSWQLFFVWMAMGLTIYFLYGMKKSKLAEK